MFATRTNLVFPSGLDHAVAKLPLPKLLSTLVRRPISLCDMFRRVAHVVCRAAASQEAAATLQWRRIRSLRTAAGSGATTSDVDEFNQEMEAIFGMLPSDDPLPSHSPSQFPPSSHHSPSPPQPSFPLDHDRCAVAVRAEASTVAGTGVEMEALTAAAVAALTVYDMCKGVSKAIEIEWVRLEEKIGGKSGEWRRGGDWGARGEGGRGN
ncbi:unnamed protein product [Closterium sp. Naga37s-1]|nr:unnamed protein product [Closterium sp. Naga37s-1]